MDTGSQIRIAGEGHAGPFGGPRGDLVVITRVHDDAVFTRKGDNLHAELPVSIIEAVLGARVAVRTLWGEVDLVLPPGTQAGQVLRMRGRGMPRLASEGRGDLYMTVVVEIPRGLDVRTQELVRDLGRLLPGPAASERRTARA
jgi:molecular chaperone DnaJ